MSIFKDHKEKELVQITTNSIEDKRIIISKIITEYIKDKRISIFTQDVLWSLISEANDKININIITQENGVIIIDKDSLDSLCSIFNIEPSNSYRSVKSLGHLTNSLVFIISSIQKNVSENVDDESKYILTEDKRNNAHLDALYNSNVDYNKRNLSIIPVLNRKSTNKRIEQYKI